MELQTITKKQTMSSREIAELTGKQHKHVLTDCDNLNIHYQSLSMAEISAVNYKAENGQFYREFLLTRMQTIDLMTGYNIELRIKINRRWEELEQSNYFKAPSTLKEALILALTQQEQIEAQQATIKELSPKALFADAVSASHNTLLIGELAKILKQNGIDIGQNRLFAWLRDNGYLIKRRGSDYNMPTQISMEIQLFEIKETTIVHNDGHTTINKTPKVTGKGQQYFINRFLNPK